MKVVVIEDDPEWIKIITMSLAHFKVPYSIIGSGEDIPALLNFNKPDLVLLDILIRYDAVEGVKILKTIKADPELADIPVIILSTDYKDLGKDETIHLGAMAYIRKDQLVAELRTLFHGLA